MGEILGEAIWKMILNIVVATVFWNSRPRFVQNSAKMKKIPVILLAINAASAPGTANASLIGHEHNLTGK